MYTKFFILTVFVITLIGCNCGDKEINIAFLTDTHVVPGNANDSLLQKAVSEINNGQYDFVILTGDLSNMGSNAELQRVHDILSRLNKPVYVIPGNHETTWSESAGHKIKELWGDDRFAFEKEGYLFIGYSSGPYMKMGDALIKPEDIRWLQHKLDNASPDVKIVNICHYPLVDGLNNWPEITRLLKKHNSIVSLCGHWHQLKFMNFDSIPGLMGRALSDGRGNQFTAGYNILRLANDSIYLAEKQLDKPAEWKIKIKQGFSDEVNQLDRNPYPPTPNYENNPAITLTLQDTAAIFTGVAVTPDQTLIYGNSLGNLIAYDPNTQKTVWRTNLEGPIYSTPVYSDNVIVCGSTNNYIIGVDAQTGKELWKVSTPSPVVNDGIIHDKAVYMGGGAGEFLKIDLLTGKVIWKYTEINGFLQGAPAVSGKNIVFGAWDSYLYCLNTDSGLLNWKWSNGNNNFLFSPGNVVPAISNQKVFIVAPDRYMTAIDINNGKQLWRTNQYRIRESMGINKDGSAIFGKTMDGEIIAVSTQTNAYKNLWVKDMGYGYDHNPCPLLENNNILYSADRQGDVGALRIKNQEIQWKSKVGYSSTNKIYADANGNIWITLIEGKIFKINHN